MTHGVMVFVHDPRENARTLAGGVMVAPGNAFYINIKPTKYTFLPTPYKSYGNLYCVDTDEEYSYEACVSDWASTQTAAYCNCTFAIEPIEVLESFPSCSLRQFAECYLTGLEKFMTHTLQENFTACPKPCSFTRYETSVSFSKFPSEAAAEKLALVAQMYGTPNADTDYIRKNALKVTLYFDRFFIENVVYSPEITINGALSSIGGQMGFFLGASLVPVVELGEARLTPIWIFGKRITGTRNKTKISSLQK